QSFQKTGNDFESLAFGDLLEARDLYHVHLMNLPHVVATALGKYRIRMEDSWPDEHGPGKHHGKGVRTLDNSEIRPYSRPCILAFVDEWTAPGEFVAGGRFHPNDMVPKALYMPDGRKIPVCVVLAERQLKSLPTPEHNVYPLNNIGGGNPVLVYVQG